MRNLIVSIIVAVLLSTSSWAGSTSYRCGNNLVGIGDSGFALEKKCGEPIQRRPIGYTVTPDGKRENYIEKWVYGPDAGFYYEITLEGDTIVKIEMVRE